MTWMMYICIYWIARSYIRLAQLVEHQSHELVVVGSSPTSDISCMVYGWLHTLTRLAQSVERTPFKRVVVGSSPTSGGGWDVPWLKPEVPRGNGGSINYIT